MLTFKGFLNIIISTRPYNIWHYPKSTECGFRNNKTGAQAELVESLFFTLNGIQSLLLRRGPDRK